MPLYEDDVLYSVKKYLEEAVFTCKAIPVTTPGEDEVSGVLFDLIPGCVVFSIRTRDLLVIPLPSIAIAYEPDASNRLAFFGGAGVYQQTLRLLCNGTVQKTVGDREEPDVDASIRATMQLKNALINFFQEDRGVPLYRVLYNAAGDVQATDAVLSLDKDPQVYDVDENRFVVQFDLRTARG